MSKVGTVVVAVLGALVGFGYYLDPSGEVAKVLTGAGAGTDSQEFDPIQIETAVQQAKLKDVVRDPPPPVVKDPPKKQQQRQDPPKRNEQRRTNSQKRPQPQERSKPQTTTTQPKPEEKPRTYQRSDFLHAIYVKKDLTLAREIFTKNPSLAAQTDQNGWTALHELARGATGNVRGVRFLVEERAVDVNARNGKERNGQTALDLALESSVSKDKAQQQDAQILVDYLYSRNAKTGQEIETETLGHAIDTAFQKSEFTTIEKILKDHPGLYFAKKRDVNGWTLLHEAARFGYLDLSRVLVEVGKADVNARNGKNYNGDSALDLAIKFKKDNVVKYLVSKGGKTAKDLDVEATASKGDYSLSKLKNALLEKRHDKVIQMVYAKPDLVRARDDNGWTILHEAARFGNLQMVKFLVEKANANILERNGKNRDKKDALGVANHYLKKYHEVVRFLQVKMKEGNKDNTKATTNDNAAKATTPSTPHPSSTYANLLKALRENNLARFKAILKDRPSLAQQKDNNGWTILHEIVRTGKVDMAEVVVEGYDADVNLRTNSNGNPGEGGSPLYYAWTSFKSDTHPMVTYLIGAGAVLIEPVKATVLVREGEEEEL